MRPYFAGDCLDLHPTRDHVIITFEVNSEGAGWDDVETPGDLRVCSK